MNVISKKRPLESDIKVPVSNPAVVSNTAVKPVSDPVAKPVPTEKQIAALIKEKVTEYIPIRKYNATDPVDIAAGVKALKDGADVIVFSRVATPNEVKQSKDYFWEYSEDACTELNRIDTNTWSNKKWPGYFSVGIFKWYGIGQSKFMHYLRALPTIRAIYETIYGTSELFTSFDGCGVFRGGEHQVNWNGSWLHVDQNKTLLPQTNVSFQGGLNLISNRSDSKDAKEASKSHGSFLFVPGSNLKYSNGPIESWLYGKDSNYCPLPFDHATFDGIRDGSIPIHILGGLDAGDFFVWNSCTTHANLPPQDDSIRDQLRRLVAYIGFQPLVLNAIAPSGQQAPKKNKTKKPKHPESKKVLVANKLHVAAQGWTTNHWPCQMNYGDNRIIYPRHSSSDPVVMPAACRKTTFTYSEWCLVTGTDPKRFLVTDTLARSSTEWKHKLVA